MFTRENISSCVIALAALSITLTVGWLLYSCYLTYSSLRTSGIVVQLVERRYKDVVYCPVFTFRDASGVDHTIHSSVGSNPPRFPVGTAVSVLYRPKNPAGAQIEDRVILWLVPVILMALSVIYGTLGFIIGRWPQRASREHAVQQGTVSRCLK